MAHSARALTGAAIAATIAFVSFAAPPPDAVAATTTEIRSCTDGGGHLWKVRSVWGDAYTGADGKRHVVNDLTGFASAAADATTVDYTIRSLNPDGSVYWSRTASDVSYDFTRTDGSLRYLDRNPGNPLWGPGRSKVTVSLGDGNDGFGNCTVTFTQPSASLSAPTNVTASNITPTTMTVNWQAPTSTGTSPILGYVVAWGAWESTRQTGTSMDLTNFAPNTKYTVNVYAENSSGRGPAQAVTFTTPAQPTTSPSAPTATSPSAPTNVTASNITPTTMTVNWQAPTSTGTSPILGYVVAWGAWESTRQTGTSMDLTNFAPNTKYTVNVYAENSSGRGPAQAVTFTTPAQPTTSPSAPTATSPSAPTNVTASNITPTTMTVNWQAPTSTGTSPILGYVVAWGAWESTRQTGTSMDLTNFAPNTKYTVNVYAENSSGRGPAQAVTFTTTAAPAGGVAGRGLPNRVTGVYWTRWNSQIPVSSVPSSYNVVYLFAATKGATEGSLAWGQNVSGLATARSRGQRVILSTGGAGQGINFSTRAVSQNFVNSIVRINAELGGTTSAPAIDGVDFNTFEAEATPNTSEYLWMFGELKRIFGASFLITSPPAPWKGEDKAMVREALARGLMDYAAPQFYDGPGLADPAYIVNTTRDWIKNVAGGDARKIVVGFGYSPGSANYSSIQQIQQAWGGIESEFPGIRGAFVWQHATDAANGWPFANGVNPLVAN